MRVRKAFILFAWAVTAALLIQPAGAYYHFTQYANRNTPYGPIPEKFDLNALPNKTLTFLVSDNGPTLLQPNDSFASVLGNVRQAALVWNSVDSSDLRVAFGGLYTPGAPSSTPGAQVIFSDDVQPGVIEQAGPIAPLGRVTNGPNGPFIPINNSVILIRRDLAQNMPASYTDMFFTTLVHEMGHALGLQHTFTSSAMSTFVTRATTRTKPIDADDIAGLTVLYPKAGALAQFGSISGRVTSNSQGVHLASVVALRPTGAGVSAVTQPDGTYRIDGLPPDNYWVYVHSMPPAAQNGLGPGDVVLPLDPAGRPVAATGPVETLFFPGTRDPSRFAVLPVSRGNIVGSIDFSVQPRTSVAIHDVIPYSYFGQVPVSPAYVNSTGPAGSLVATGFGLIAGGQPASGLGVQVLGGTGALNVRPYTATYLALDLPAPLPAGLGPRHLYFTLANDAYVLPNGLNLTQKAPPSILSVSPQADGSVSIAGSSLALDSRVYFDALPATMRSFTGTEALGTAIVTPPAGFNNQLSAVTVYNSDGQNSTFLQPTPTLYSYGPAAQPSFALSPAAATLPAGTSAWIDITGVNTNWVEGQTALGMGSSDVSVRRVWVLAPNHLWANVTVAPNAAPAAYSASVFTGFQLSEQPFSLQVTAANPRLPVIAVPLTNTQGLSGIYAGTMVTLTGSNLVAGGGGGTLTLADQPVQILFASSNRIDFMVPGALPPGPALLKLNNGVDTALPVVVEIDPPPPQIVGLFSAANAALDTSHPANAGDIVTVWLSNLDPAVAAAPGRVHMSEGNADLTALSIAPVAGQPNLYQVTFVLSPVVSGPQITVAVALDGSASAPVLLAVR
jgi:uncharacterized protein (TIGR03437 family)